MKEFSASDAEEYGQTHAKRMNVVESEDPPSKLLRFRLLYGVVLVLIVAMLAAWLARY